MKKNRLMRLACLLIVLTLMTSCFVGGTFAKYTTTVEASDTARVAAWGFGTASTIDFNLFSTSYDEGASDPTVTSSNTDRVIAPGTAQTETVKLHYANTSGKGAPEVDYTITLAVDTANTSIDNSIKENANIKWSFQGTTFTSGTKSSWEQLLDAINAYTEDVEANNLPNIANTGITIGWEWDYSVDATGDDADTKMGDATTLASCKLAIKLIAEQVN